MDKNNFSQKLAELTALAAVSENKLQMTQVLDAFAKEQVTPEEMESVYAKLEKKGDPDTDRGGRRGFSR